MNGAKTTPTVRAGRKKKTPIEPRVESGLREQSLAANGKRGDGYAIFLSRKSIVATPAGIANPQPISEKLFPFQQACVRWALIKGRAALFEGTGLGKTVQQVEWARHVGEFTGKPVLILAPLGVAHQTPQEASKLLGEEVRYVEQFHEILDRGTFITNYGKMDRFRPEVFGGVVWDESSIIKNQDGKTRQKIIDYFGMTPFRLACTATPAPNDYMELGSHCEALGIMKATEMLATFFVHDGGDTAKWRLKGHAEQSFWKWLASWSICITHPSQICTCICHSSVKNCECKISTVRRVTKQNLQGIFTEVQNTSEACLPTASTATSEKTEKQTPQEIQ